MNWVAYLKYFQTVFKKFDFVAALDENLLIYYFCKGLRPFICAQFDEKDHNLDNWNHMIKEIINGKTKVYYQPLSFTFKNNARYFYGYCPNKGKKSKVSRDSDKATKTPLSFTINKSGGS